MVANKQPAEDVTPISRTLGLQARGGNSVRTCMDLLMAGVFSPVTVISDFLALHRLLSPCFFQVHPPRNPGTCGIPNPKLVQRQWIIWWDGNGYSPRSLHFVFNHPVQCWPFSAQSGDLPRLRVQGPRGFSSGYSTFLELIDVAWGVGDYIHAITGSDELMQAMMMMMMMMMMMLVVVVVVVAVVLTNLETIAFTSVFIGLLLV